MLPGSLLYLNHTPQLWNTTILAFLTSYAKGTPLGRAVYSRNEVAQSMRRIPF